MGGSPAVCKRSQGTLLAIHDSLSGQSSGVLRLYQCFGKLSGAEDRVRDLRLGEVSRALP
jgi:hypothetical protein